MKGIEIKEYFERLDILIEKGEEAANLCFMLIYYPIMICIEPFLGFPKHCSKTSWQKKK